MRFTILLIIVEDEVLILFYVLYQTIERERFFQITMAYLKAKFQQSSS